MPGTKHGHWRADYEPWVQMLAGMYRGPGKQIVAWNSALLYDMIYTQPVVYELGELQMQDPQAFHKALLDWLTADG